MNHPVLLSQNQIEALEDISDNAEGFVDATNKLIASFELIDCEDAPRKPVDVNNEIKQLRKTLEDLSIEAKLHLHRVKLIEEGIGPLAQPVYLRESHDNPVDRFLNLTKKEFKAERWNKVKRKRLYYSALLVFVDYDLDVRNFKEGPFVEYLTIIIDALELNYDPYRLARDYSSPSNK